MNIEGRKMLVAGAGVSGKNACRLLLANGARVILYDGNASLDGEALRQELGSPQRLTVALGELRPELLEGVEHCVISPGIPLDSPLAQQLQQKGIPVWSEVELAYRAARGRLAAITGTNGKTTTTALTGKICADYQPSVFVVGNIGNAYTREALKTTPESITVAEVSSFQLETIDTFHPQVSAILNITPDHLNRHKTMENYARVKERGLRVIQHSCGDIAQVLPDLIEIGLDCYQTFQPEIYDIEAVKAAYGDRLTFWGGISTQQLLPFATPEQVKAEVARLIGVLGEGGGYIAAPTHAVPADVPPDNIVAMNQALRGQRG